MYIYCRKVIFVHKKDLKWLIYRMMEQNYKAVIIDDDASAADHLLMALQKYPFISVENLSRTAAAGKRSAAAGAALFNFSAGNFSSGIAGRLCLKIVRAGMYHHCLPKYLAYGKPVGQEK